MTSMKNSAVVVALLGLGFAGIGSAQAATCATAGACFEFVGGYTNLSGSVAAQTYSWFSIQTGLSPDTIVYTPMLAASSTDIPGPNGFLNFSQINTLGIGTGAGTGPGGTAPFHNSGNMIDRDWSFLGVWGAHYTNQILEVTGSGNTRSVNMAGWTMGWNSSSINVGTGGPAVIDNVDGIWSNGNDTLDYSAVIPTSDPSGFGDVNYAFHMVGSYAPVPLPAAVWLLGSGLIGLVGFARRRRALVT